MERLRYLARLDPGQVRLIGIEAAETLLGCAGEPAELVVACRRLLDRHPAAGPLWWVASKALTAPDAVGALTAAARQLEHDPTQLFLETDLATRPDAVAVDAWSFGTNGVFADPEAVAAATAATAAGRTVLIHGGHGRGLPEPIWRVAVTRVRRAAARRPALLGWAGVTAVVGPAGTQLPDEARASASCPIAPELLTR